MKAWKNKIGFGRQKYYSIFIINSYYVFMGFIISALNRLVCKIWRKKIVVHWKWIALQVAFQVHAKVLMIVVMHFYLSRHAKNTRDTIKAILLHNIIHMTLLTQHNHHKCWYKFQLEKIVIFYLHLITKIIRFLWIFKIFIL